MAHKHRILYCHCSGTDPRRQPGEDRTLQDLIHSDIAFDAVCDLCRMVARHPDHLASILSPPATILACFPRAIDALLAAAGVEDFRGIHKLCLLDGGNLPTLEISPQEAADPPPRLVPPGVPLAGIYTTGPAALPYKRRESLIPRLLAAGINVRCMDCLCELPVLASNGPLAVIGLLQGQVDEGLQQAGGDSPLRIIDATELADGEIVQRTRRGFEEMVPDADDGWKPWFPVIDRDRCADCLQCLGFCLFGVYEKTESGQARVQNPDKCKTGCPACARVCPHGAILFPKHTDAPVNGDERAEGEAVPPAKVDLSSLVRGDLYAQLRARGSSSRAQPACDCTERLKEQLGIPQQVIDQLTGEQQSQIADRADPRRKEKP